MTSQTPRRCHRALRRGLVAVLMLAVTAPAAASARSAESPADLTPRQASSVRADDPTWPASPCYRLPGAASRPSPACLAVRAVLGRSFSRSASATGVAAAPTPPGGPLPCLTQAGVNDRCEQWATAYNDATRYTNSHSDFMAGMVVSRKGDRVFVTGTTVVDDVARATTAAFNATTGALLWVTHGSDNPPSAAVGLVASPDGGTVYVTGVIKVTLSLNQPAYYLYFTAAYDAANGRQRWWQRFVGIGGQFNAPSAIAVSPQGDRVYVTGAMSVPGVGSVPPINYATLAYAARTGKALWGSRYLGDSGQNVPTGLVVSPRGDRVFVTGYSQYFNPSPTPLFKYATVGYAARTGSQLWVARYGSFRDGTSRAAAVAPSPRGDLVFVTGQAQYAGSIGAPQFAYATIAYRAATGRPAWTAQFVGAAGSSDGANDVVVAPRGDLVYVTGASSQPQAVAGNALPSVGVAATVAYAAATGKQVWLARFVSPVPTDNAVGVRLAVDAAGRLAVAAVVGPVPGLAGQAAVVSYDARRGSQSWVARYDLRDPTLAGGNYPVALTYSTKGGRLYREDQMAPVSNTCVPTTTCSDEPSYGLLLSFQP